MKNRSLLRATRDVYVLADKPNSTSADSTKYWSIKIDGLDPADIRCAVNHLREKQLENAQTHEERQALKATSLYDSIAKSLGAKSHRHWLNEEYPKIQKFLDEHGMHTPTDLIKWQFRPGFCDALTARRLADRFFSSELPLPKRMFTGVGSYLFAPSGYGRMDVQEVAGQYFDTDEAIYDYCVALAEQRVLRAVHMRDGCQLSFLDLTGRTLMLHAVSEFIGSMYCLIGDNLMDPMIKEPVMRSYNMSILEKEFELKVFHLFRQEVESSNDGWVEVIPLPDNSHIVFLKGKNGCFDWIIRDQRDEKYSSNNLYPFFRKEELPSAISQNKLDAHLYFSTGRWQEELEHRAEEKHYLNGGTVRTWPGYKKLIEKELFAEGYNTPRVITGKTNNYFVPHRLDKYCLMVSPLITIREFFEFYVKKDWGQTRLERAREANWDIESNLMSVNSDPDQSLPVSVTWLDAIAYCGLFQRETALPVRLLSVDEWRQIAPPAKPDQSALSALHTIERGGSGRRPRDSYWEKRGWCVEGSDRRFGKDSSDCYSPNGKLLFNSNFQLFSNNEGLDFVESPGFGEWLGDRRYEKSALIAAAYADEKARSSIESDSHSITYTLREEGLKTGFRICYIANADA
ncbi:hypothetical protein [Undibacterium sp. Di24W]|uniref:hypothetical protein n=1 Tax=Undibacterium sp. Di24W TaxID=3413033 RepID=UPI003BEFABCF